MILQFPFSKNSEVTYRTLKIETGRYGVNKVPVEEWLCEACISVEDEFHVLMKCPLYRDAMPGGSILILSAPFRKYLQIRHKKSQFLELMSNPLHLHHFLSFS